MLPLYLIYWLWLCLQFFLSPSVSLPPLLTHRTTTATYSHILSYRYTNTHNTHNIYPNNANQPYRIQSTIQDEDNTDYTNAIYRASTASVGQERLLELLQRDQPTLRHANMTVFQSFFQELDQNDDHLTDQDRTLLIDSTLDLTQYSMSINNTNEDNNADVEVVSARQNSPFIARFITWLLYKIVRKRTQYVYGLNLHVYGYSNRQLLRGQIDSIDMKFDKISFNQIFVSGGGRLLVKGIDLRMRRSFFSLQRQCIRHPYIIYADFLLTQQDIINSKFIRNTIQLLVNTILERVLQTNNILNASIRQVSIKTRRLCAQGTVRLLSNEQDGNDGLVSIDFDISTSAGMRDEGQVLYLKDIQVTLNPDSILRTVVPILPTTPIDIDLGEDCRIERLVIGNKNIWIRGASIISPIASFSVMEAPKKALYRYDISASLSNLLRFTGGVAMRWRK